jgi:hypothetical protein
MPSMSESLVDLSYRGLNLGKRIKLTQVRPSTGYLEMPAPMPVGTAIGIATDNGVLLEAVVAETREQSGGDRAPGMVVRPKLDADTARSWWKERVALPELEKAAPRPDSGGKVTVVARDRAVPELVDDGRSTGVTDVIEEPAVQRRHTNPGMGALAGDQQGVKRDTDPAVEVPQRDSGPALVDDGKRTIAMSAIDLEALGLDPSSSSGSFPAADDEPDTDNPDNPDNPDKPKKKKRRRR